jgi:hypothetical protein
MDFVSSFPLFSTTPFFQNFHINHTAFGMLLHAFPSMSVSSLRELPQNCVYRHGGFNCFIKYLHRKLLTTIFSLTGAWGMDFVSSFPLFSTTPFFQNFHINHSFFKMFIIIRFSSFDNISSLSKMMKFDLETKLFRYSRKRSTYLLKFEHGQLGKCLSRSNFIILDRSARTITLGFLRMEYLQ